MSGASNEEDAGIMGRYSMGGSFVSNTIKFMKISTQDERGDETS